MRHQRAEKIPLLSCVRNVVESIGNPQEISSNRNQKRNSHTIVVSDGMSGQTGHDERLVQILWRLCAVEKMYSGNGIRISETDSHDFRPSRSCSRRSSFVGLHEWRPVIWLPHWRPAKQ